MFAPSLGRDVEITKLVLVPTREKSSGYGVGAFFAFTPNKGWWRPMNYDCWRVVPDLHTPARVRYSILKGDFEYGGVNIFGFLDEHHKAYMGYGGEVTIVPSKSDATTNLKNK